MFASDLRARDGGEGLGATLVYRKGSAAAFGALLAMCNLLYSRTEHMKLL